MSRTRRDESERLWQEAQRVIPGGVNSPVRAFSAVGGTPVFFQRGAGSRLYDVDGNAYIDYVASWGPLILGHGHPAVIAAVESALRDGTSFGACTAAEVELASRIVAAVPSIEKVRLVNSGTEATMSAIRVARGFTGRSKIIKMAGCYHGHADYLLVQAGSGATTFGVPTSPGVPADFARNTIIVPYNDANAVEDAFRAEPNDIAGVILEPIAGNMGLVLPEEGYLQALREITTRYDALLIFDEVITGFRVAYGGAQARFGIVPDLTCLGKIVGGGLPVGAYGGRSDIIGVVSPEGPVYQAGTLSGNPLATAAGNATLKTLEEPGTYARLERIAARLEAGIRRAMEHAPVPVTLARIASMFCLFFGAGPFRAYEDAMTANTAQFGRLFHALLKRGVYLPPGQYETFFVSLAHSEEDIDTTVEAFREALTEVEDSSG